MWLLNPYIAFPPTGIVIPSIGDPFEGGFFAGLISHTADGSPTHALIMAPRATGATGTGYALTTNLRWKAAGTATANTTSPFDGAANTAGMLAAGIVDHPAAEFCVNLSIGGFADWYLPARYELDIAYENLKPATGSNTAGFGINEYSVPKRTINRTASSPAQTSITAFQSPSGAEHVIADGHWSSTQGGTTATWNLNFSSGDNNFNQKTSFSRVRAFRRIAL